MRGRLITFTNLFPSAAFPNHGLFVRERMRRVVAAAGVDWVVVCPVPRVPLGLRRGDYARFAAMPEREVVDGVEVWHPAYLHLPGFSTQRQAKRMARAAFPVIKRLCSAGASVLDAHYVYPDGVAALMIARRLRLPTLVTARGSDLNVLAAIPGVRRQIQSQLPSAFARLAVSEPLRQKFTDVAGLDDDAVGLSRNGVDLERFTVGDAAAARAQLGLPAKGSLILGVGRLVKSKGFHLMAENLDAAPGARLVLIGGGPERDALAALGGDRVCFLGPLPPERVALAYRACDVFVLPSEREGWPNVVTEALASGLPVVATDVGSVSHMLSADFAGAVVPVGDGVALGREVGRILKCRADRSKIRGYAERFSWDEPVADLVELIRRALG